MGMQFSVHDLLGLLSPERSVAPKVLQQKLSLDDGAALAQLQLVLDALEKVGLIEKMQGRYRLVANEEIVGGRLRCSSKGFCFVTPEQPEAEEIFVVEGSLKNAWNGDRVLVRLLKKASRRRKPEGEVVLVTERAHTALVGRLAEADAGEDKPKLLQVAPLDDRLGSVLELVDAEIPDVAADLIVEVEITRYPLGRRPAKCRLLRVLGHANDPLVDLDLVASRYQLPLEFPQAVLDAAAQLAASAAPEGREDLQALEVWALPGELLQTALSLVPTEGGWELGLHVSDVAVLVEAGSTLDAEAYRRGLAARLRDRSLRLWPDALLERCALLPDTGRSAWSVLVNLDTTGQVRAFRWTPSLVRARGRLESLSEPYAAVAAALAAQGTGPLLGASDPRIFIELLESLIGQHLAHLHLGAPFLFEPGPQGGEVVDWLRLARACGLEVPEADASVELTVRQYRTWLLEQPEGANRALRELLLTTLPVEQFAAEPRHHFGRDSMAVAPFGRPLEHYGDLLVQRLLQQVHTDGRDRKTPRSKVSVDLHSSNCHGLIDWPVLKPKVQKDWEEALPGSVSHLSARLQQVHQAQADLEGFERIGRLGTQTEPLRGLITGVQSYGFFVAVEEPFVEGLVHVSGLKDDWYTFQAREPALIGRRSRRRFQIGDTVTVKVKGIDYYRQQVDLMVVRDESEPPTEEGTEAPLLAAPEA
ncbi:gll1448 [Gloeobacter violaceus PCC 7421]|uniref:Gll1448 protein n=2 Tax=Gloeobacter violaceus TaxID=33072 RepID=Q7NKM9_GLOVI|nr:gll1448 [Gloeobacter violaceus PCC 7421]